MQQANDTWPTGSVARGFLSVCAQLCSWPDPNPAMERRGVRTESASDTSRISTRAGTSLLEAVLAVALLGTLVLFTIPVVHGSRAATEQAIAVIETAALAEHMRNVLRVDGQSSDKSLVGRNAGGDFDPPFQGYHWRVGPTASGAAEHIAVITVSSTNASTTLVAVQ